MWTLAEPDRVDIDVNAIETGTLTDLDALERLAYQIYEQGNTAAGTLITDAVAEIESWRRG